MDIIFDIETDSLKQRGGPRRVHCAEALVAQTGETFSFANQPGYLKISDLLDLLQSADRLVAHNGLAFDVPTLERIYRVTFDRDRVVDTLTGARTVFSAIREQDKDNTQVPANLKGRHSLEAWGFRLGVLKSCFGKTQDWQHWSRAMSDYCQQDTIICAALYLELMKEADSQGVPFVDSDAWRLERDIIGITNRITAIGFPFDVDACQRLLAELETATGDIAAQLQQAFPPRIVETPFTPKRRNVKKGYWPGTTIMKRKEVPFNPNSSDHISSALMERHGWVPRHYTETGEPSVTSKILATLDYPEAALLTGYKMAEKRIGMITGPSGWLESVQDGRLHTDYHTNATITGRCSHSPNVSQVPKPRKKDGRIPRGMDGAWGYECRDLFAAPPGWLLVGADMQGLELRCLAHYLAQFDDGEYAALVQSGDQHSHTQEVTGLDSRDKAKTLIYATIYGAGDYKAGTIVLPDEDDDDMVRAIGHDTRTLLVSGIRGFADLFRWLDRCDDLEGLDGRKLVARKKHAKLNTLLQAAGAILCKRWLLLIDAELHQRGLRHGEDYEFLCWVHDEAQCAARTREVAEIVAQVCKDQAVKAGEYYGLACPTAAEARIGFTWAETH